LHTLLAVVTADSPVSLSLIPPHSGWGDSRTGLTSQYIDEMAQQLIQRKNEIKLAQRTRRMLARV